MGLAQAQYYCLLSFLLNSPILFYLICLFICTYIFCFYFQFFHGSLSNNTRLEDIHQLVYREGNCKHCCIPHSEEIINIQQVQLYPSEKQDNYSEEQQRGFQIDLFNLHNFVEYPSDQGLNFVLPGISRGKIKK